MLEIFVANLFDTKVVNAQIKADGVGDVLPRRVCVVLQSSHVIPGDGVGTCLPRSRLVANRTCHINFPYIHSL